MLHNYLLNTENILVIFVRTLLKELIRITGSIIAERVGQIDFHYHFSVTFVSQRKVMLWFAIVDTRRVALVKLLCAIRASVFGSVVFVLHVGSQSLNVGAFDVKFLSRIVSMCDVDFVWNALLETTNKISRISLFNVAFTANSKVTCWNMSSAGGKPIVQDIFLFVHNAKKCKIPYHVSIMWQCLILSRTIWDILVPILCSYI